MIDEEFGLRVTEVLAGEAGPPAAAAATAEPLAAAPQSAAAVHRHEA